MYIIKSPSLLSLEFSVHSFILSYVCNQLASCQLGMIQDTLSLSDFLHREPSLDFVDPSVSQCMIPILGGGPTSVGQRMSPILEEGPIQNENSGS